VRAARQAKREPSELKMDNKTWNYLCHSPPMTSTLFIHASIVTWLARRIMVSKVSISPRRTGRTMTEGEQQIAPGISVSASGQATVDPSLTNVLFDLAIKLEETTQLPVDVQHILAAIVLAARRGQIDPSTTLSADNPALASVLVPHVKAVFSQFDGKVGVDD
jgi:hypothetical protein